MKWKVKFSLKFSKEAGRMLHRSAGVVCTAPLHAYFPLPTSLLLPRINRLHPIQNLTIYVAIILLEIKLGLQ